LEPLPVVLTRAQVRAADERAVRDLKVPPGWLMENAGRGLASVTESVARAYGIGGAIVVAARGNNGGDGLVAARHLLLRGLPVRVLLASPAASYDPSTDPGRNLEAVRALGIPVLEAAAGLPAGHLLVDAVLGTGLEGPVREDLAQVLRWMASTGRPVVAADLPSGLDADTGEERGPVPRCVATATFLALKPGLLRGRGPDLAGKVTVCDIGVPVEAVTGGSRPASRP